MKTFTLKGGASAFKSLLLCQCKKIFLKDPSHITCTKAKHFRKKYSLHFKFISLSVFNSFFKRIDFFCKKHPIFLQMMIFLLAVVASYLVEARFTENTQDELERLISKGFFIAPLVTLMVSNQKAIVNHFSAVFFYDKKQKEIDSNIDKDNIAHKKDIDIREMMIEVVYAVTPNKRISDYVQFTRRIIEDSLAVREGNDYRNATAMIFSGSALMIGFFMLLFGYYGVALSFLFYSLLLILAKEILGIRSIIKRSLFARFLSRLNVEKDKLLPEERKKAVFGK